MLFFKRSYQSLFANKYKNLLKGIEDMDYDLLEQTCQKSLLSRLASEIYQINKIEGCQFEIVNQKAKINAQIVNYSQLLIPETIDDKNYENYVLVENSKGVWEFQHKDSVDSLIEELELRLKAK